MSRLAVTLSEAKGLTLTEQDALTGRRFFTPFRMTRSGPLHGALKAAYSPGKSQLPKSETGVRPRCQEMDRDLQTCNCASTQRDSGIAVHANAAEILNVVLRKVKPVLLPGMVVTPQHIALPPQTQPAYPIVPLPVAHVSDPCLTRFDGQGRPTEGA